MSELRKPNFTFLLKKQGNKTKKVELFDSEQWGVRLHLRNNAKKYRLRVNGKWFPVGNAVYYDKWEIRNLLWRSISL